MSIFLKNKSALSLFILVLFTLSTLYFIFSGTTKNLTAKFSKDKFYSGELTVTKCKKLTQGQDQCWEDLMVNLATEKGVSVALDVLSNISDTYEPFSQVCHDLTHTIGGEAYSQFMEDKELTATPKSVYCNYGFYHGFMETLASSSGDPQKAREFCSSIDRQMAAITPDVSLQCYHGIGHGWTNVHDNPELWGDESAIVAPALALCEEVKDTWEQSSRCLTGVFHGIAIFYITGEYGVSLNRDDPLWLCRQLEEEYRNECYVSMHGVLRHATGDNFLAAAKFISDIPEDKYARPAIMHLAMATSGRGASRPSYKDGLDLCRALGARLRTPCIQGYAFGLFRQDASGEEYKEPLNFCKATLLADEERAACLEYIFSYLNLWYSNEKAQNICKNVEEQYRELCYSQLRPR